jgi:hypothetical protein
MTTQVPRRPGQPTDSETDVPPHDEVAMKRDREEWDNEGGAARLPIQGSAMPSAETRNLSDIPSPAIMVSGTKGTLGCTYND